MILVDTSVWIDHLRHGNRRLAGLLEEERVLCHPFVTGELALGHLRHRAEILELMANLPQASPQPHEAVLGFVEEHSLIGSGLGWVDVHLLCAAARGNWRLWTMDRRLALQAERLELS